MRWRHDLKVSLKQPMSKDAKFRKHRSAEDNRIIERGAINVLYHVRHARPNQHFANRLDEARSLMTIPVSSLQGLNMIDTVAMREWHQTLRGTSDQA